VLLALSTPASAGESVPRNEGDLAAQAQSLLAERCYRCHGPEKHKSGLRLDLRAEALRGGDLSERVLVPGDRAQSDLTRRIASTDPEQVMPPKGPRLTAPEIELLRRWIDAGASWANVGSGGATPARIARAQGPYWAFQPVRDRPPPDVEGSPWIKTPIDAFILARLHREGLHPAPRATDLELIRRVAFDLTGLPPTPAEIDLYLHDTAPGAYERMVERYLQSPHHGERCAQHWLDVVRFAESEGFEYDRQVAGLWRYRDYVIKSFNDDKPYDRFILEQLAGDELDTADQDVLIAAGFQRLGPVRRNAGNQDVASSRNEVLTERTDIIGAAFLGLTIGCARCHDHKFDPISQADYYRLQAFFAASDEHNIVLASESEQAEWNAKAAVVKQKMAAITRAIKATTDDAEKQRLTLEMEALEDTLPPPLPTIATVKDTDSPVPIHILKRGDPEKQADAVGMRPPSTLVPQQTPELPVTTDKPRTRLANWLTDPSHPLTARVAVNRIWANHFGQGLVRTPNDFGINGSGVTHAELLDYLAARFVKDGWRMKPIHRLILLSSTYQQSCAVEDPAARTKDPDDRLLWHFQHRRLSAEEVRDAMLSASGRLNPKMNGESILIPVDRELVAQLYKPSQWTVTRDAREHDRRSIYLLAKRNLRLPFLDVFDQPTAQSSCARRQTSTHAPQALELLNGPIANDLAATFADRLAREAGQKPDDQIDLAFRLAAGRPPTPQERHVAATNLQNGSLKEFALAIFNLNAFLYVD
jgi:mono/diheme cytochrome c family protein